MTDQSKLSIGIDDIGIAEALARWSLVVPPNQRRYAWDEEYVEQLFHDLTKAFDERKPIYFLGTIVLTEGTKGTREVADGQQRLATTAILLAAMRDYLFELGDDQGASHYQSELLLKYDPPSGTHKSRIRLNTEDDQYFTDRVLLPPEERKADSASQYHSNERIETAAGKARDHVKNITAALSPNDRAGRIYEWIDFLRNNALVVSITVPSHISDSFRMFETLNARGLQASQVDILKNFLFGKARDAGNKIHPRWMSMLSTIESHGNDDLVLTYIRHYWISQHGPTTENELGEAVESKIKNEAQAINFAAELDAAAQDYVALLTPLQHPRWQGYSMATRKAIDILVNDLNAVQIRPLMLAIARKFSEKEANKAFRLFVSWSVRFLIVGGGSQGKLHRYYGLRAQEVTRGDIKNADDLAKSMSDLVPGNRQFEEEFSRANVSKSYLARYYLRAIELHGKDPDPQLLINEDPNAVNLEHVLPLNPSPEWGVDKETAATFYKRIGNMVLLGAKDNVALGNGTFDTKRPVLQLSPFTTTQDVGGRLDWNADEIKSRQADLAKLAPLVWPLS
jgi:uncharacterized protein DUF262/uncharacterized protein DUF1524